MVFTVQSSVWFIPGVVFGVGIGLFVSCQLLHVLYVWAVGSVHCPSLVNVEDDTYSNWTRWYRNISEQGTSCVVLRVVLVVGWLEVGFGGLPCGRVSPLAWTAGQGASLEQGSMGDVELC